ncbi:hypothetical protein XF24_00044 [candidate division SR1 bacterium Aalborg_AAW-1]|nr:hypothetical protein XF24_00044 [candidate division SR1 bacterium Aalborg_AAW-1]
MKKILYIDMDGVLVDFQSGINRLSPLDKVKYALHPSNAPGIFALMDPHLELWMPFIFYQNILTPIFSRLLLGTIRVLGLIK